MKHLKQSRKSLHISPNKQVNVIMIYNGVGVTVSINIQRTRPRILAIKRTVSLRKIVHINIANYAVW